MDPYCRPLRRSPVAAPLLASRLQAQSNTGAVTGVVSTLEDGSALAGASVAVVGASLGVLTDERGRYLIRGIPAGTISLRFTRIGYTTLTKTVTVVAGRRLGVDAEMGAGPIRLDPLRVLMQRTRMLGDPLGMDELPGAAHVLVAGDLESPAFVFDNVHDFLRMVPGVNVQDEDGYGLRPNIGLRGTGVDRSAKITLMEDGILIAPAPYAAPSAYYFPVAGRMEAIEVRKGSSQVKYGPRTIGGAINLVSSSIPEAFSWFVEGSGGEDGMRKGHVRVGDSRRRFGWVVEAYSLETDGFKELVNGDATGFDIGDYMAKFRVNSDRGEPTYQELELKLGYTDERSSETYLGLTDADFGLHPFLRYPASQPDVMNAQHSQIQLRHFWTRGKLDVTTTLYRNDFSRNWYKLQSVLGTGISSVLAAPQEHSASLAILKGASSDPDALQVRANNRDYFGQGVQSTLGLTAGTHDIEFGARFHQDEEDRFQWEDGFQMVNGAMVRTSSGEPGTQTNRVSSASALAFFLQDEFKLGRVIVTPGVRFEHIDFTRTDYAKTDPGRTEPTRVRETEVNAWIPGVGFSYRAARSLNLFGGIHRGFGPQGPGADDATRSESSVNYELGGRWRDSGLAAQATGFFSDYSNILGRATLSTTEDGTGEAFNGGDVNVVGAEFSLDYDLAWGVGWLARVPVRVAYTYTRAEFRSDFESDYDPWGTVEKGDRLPYLPEHQVSGSVAYEHPRWSATLSTVASGAMRTEAGQGDIAEGQGTDAYVVVNLAGEVHLQGMGTLFVGVQNLTDTRYSVARRPAGLRPGLPRTLIAGFRVRGSR